jgi:predicted ATPase
VSPARRQRIHLRLAQAIERIHADAFEEHAIDLAYHLLQAGDAATDRAATLRYLAMAAKREIAQSAYETASYHLRTALRNATEIASLART